MNQERPQIRPRVKVARPIPDTFDRRSLIFFKKMLNKHNYEYCGNIGINPNNTMYIYSISRTLFKYNRSPFLPSNFPLPRSNEELNIIDLENNEDLQNTRDEDILEENISNIIQNTIDSFLETFDINTPNDEFRKKMKNNPSCRRYTENSPRLFHTHPNSIFLSSSDIMHSINHAEYVITFLGYYKIIPNTATRSREEYINIRDIIYNLYNDNGRNNEFMRIDYFINYNYKDKSKIINILDHLERDVNNFISKIYEKIPRYRNHISFTRWPVKYTKEILDDFSKNLMI